MKRRLLIVALLLALTPSLLYARWIKDKVIFEVPATGTVEFSHYNHLEAVGKNCPTFHNAVFNLVREKNPTATMNDMEQGKSCGFCHIGDKAFSVKEDCSSCHPTRDITFPVEDAGPVLFSHAVHTGMFGCSECHPDLFVPNQAKNPKATMDQMSEGISCGACHDGSTAFSVTENCETCHQM